MNTRTNYSEALAKYINYLLTKKTVVSGYDYHSLV